MKNLKQKIIQYQAENCFTQAEVAKRCKISATYLNKIMKGVRSPSDVTIAKILMVVERKE